MATIEERIENQSKSYSSTVTEGIESKMVDLLKMTASYGFSTGANWLLNQVTLLVTECIKTEDDYNTINVLNDFYTKLTKGVGEV